MAPLHRSFRAAGLLVVALAACGPGPEPQVPQAATGCDGPRLRTCERDLKKAVRAGQVPVALVASYAKAREAQNSGDPWAKLWSELAERGAARVGIVDTRAGGAGLAAAEAKVIKSAALPEPTEASAAEIVAAMSAAAGYDHAVWVGAGADGKGAFEMYPNDPLAPLLLGVTSVIDGGAGEKHLAKNLQIAAAIRRAFEAAGSFRYVDAAREVDLLATLGEGRDAWDEPVMRARYTRVLFMGAGIGLEAPARLFGSDAAAGAKIEPIAKPAPVPAPAASDSPYGDLLRVRLADDTSAEWKRRGARVLGAVPEERRKLVDAYFGPPLACGETLAPPAYESVADIGLAGLLPGALLGARVEAIAAAQSGAGLPLSAWYARYEALVKLVDQTRLAWLEMPVLLRQRGELAGISGAGTLAYKRVSDLGLKHLGALRELSQAEPEKYAATAELGLAYSPGLLGDEPLRNALIDLTQATTKGKLARSAEPEAIAGSLLMGVFAGMAYPPAIQSAHYLALQSAFAAKVKGDLSKKTGWGAAGLFALDAIFRVIADLGPNLGFSSEQIVRTLSDPNIALPNVAAVVSAAARYAALARDKPLSAFVKPAQMTPERGAAREALRKAIVDMGGPGEAPLGLADEITTLADGLIAVATGEAHRKAPPPGTCADKPRPGDFELAHALTKLREVRQKILQNARFKSGDGLWVRRARLLVMALSDGMDFAAAPAKPGAPKLLSLPAGEVESALSGALREWDEPGARDAIVGIYSLARFLLSRDTAASFQGGGPHLVRALGGIGRFLRGGSGAGGATMLDALAEASGKEAGSADLLGALVSYAKTFYAKGQADQGDVFLLGTLLLTAMRRAAPPPEALALAAAHKSRIEWALSLFAEATAVETTGKPNVLAYAAGARKAAGEQCAAGRPDDMTAVMGAVAQFSEGKRKEARAALDGVLARADEGGLVVPKMQYQYSEKHDKKIFTLSFGLTHGLAFVEGANSFQIGLGISSISDRTSKLTVSAASPEETATETARYYVRTAALAAAYNFLDGDPVQGAIDARRAVSAVVSGVRLGARAVTSERAKWAEDSRALLAVDAQLAADAGLPFLAGDLWTIVKGSLPPEVDDTKVAEVLAKAPTGLVALKEAEAPIERARKALRVLAGPLACTAAKVETASYEQPVCAGYSLALSLRVADVVNKMPRLKKSADEAPSCAALKSLDAFLGAADQGQYDPDAFTKAVQDLRADGRADEASTLLGRHRRDGHCSPTLQKLGRELGRLPALLPASRADMLAVAVNCTASDGGADLEKDLLALDEQTKKLADPMRNLKLLLFVADLSLRSNKPGLLLPLVRTPGYVDRFLHMHGNALAAALLLHHAAHLLAKEAFDSAQTEGSFALVCSAFPSDERRTECDDLKALRDVSKALADRQTLAKEALGRLLAPPVAPAKKP